MTITLQSLYDQNVPVETLRDFIITHNGVDEYSLPQEEGEILYLARAQYLQPKPGTPAAQIADTLDGRLAIIPILNWTGSSIMRVSRKQQAFKGPDGKTGYHNHLVFTYTDGVMVSLWCDMGDHGITLVTDGEGKAAFYTSLTSDGYFDAYKLFGQNDIGFIEQVHHIANSRLHLLTGDVNAAAIAAEPSVPVNPRFGRGAAPAAPLRPNLAKLYAAPPSPKGRAPLGRR